ncbi:hypothetical protein D3C79_879530 [compost metagenome]
MNFQPSLPLYKFLMHHQRKPVLHNHIVDPLLLEFPPHSHQLQLALGYLSDGNNQFVLVQNM